MTGALYTLALAVAVFGTGTVIVAWEILGEVRKIRSFMEDAFWRRSEARRARLKRDSSNGEMSN